MPAGTETAPVVAKDTASQPTLFATGCIISLPARMLLNILRGLMRSSLKRGKDFAWPKQKTLAKQMDRSVRSVQQYLAELERARLVKKCRTLFGSRYYLLDPHEAADVARQNCASASAEDCASASAETAHPDAQPAAHAHRDLKESDIRRSSSSKEAASPAAAPPLAIEKTNQAAEAHLVDLGMPRSLASRFAAADPGLVLVAAPFFQACFSDRHREPIRNKTAFMRGIMGDPKGAGFEQFADGAWKPPPDYAGPDKRKVESDRIEAEAAEGRRVREEFERPRKELQCVTTT